MEVRQQVIGAYERDYTAYDANGNLTAFTDLRTAANDTYGYDPLNRLVTADGTFGSQAFGYDRNANRLSLLDNGAATTYDYAPGSNRLVREGSATVTLDANGNITNQGQRAYTHSPDNRIVSVSEGGSLVATYAYNALGQRVSKTVGGITTRFIYGQGGELLAETDATGTVLREYIYLNGAPLAVFDASGVHYLHTDHLGTPRAATDQTGGLVWIWIADPFGTIAANDDPDGDGTTFTLNLRFPGQYFDTETGLHYNYFRYYDPATGRYVTSDPIGLAGGLNTYGYVGGNPVGRVDFYGLCECENIRLYRKDTNIIGSYLFGENDRWGHYWIEINEPYTDDFQLNPEFRSYGWYPDEENINEFGTINEGLQQDPHAPGLDDVPYFHPKINADESGCLKKCQEAQQCIVNFAESYNGLWDLFSRSCRDFQREAMKSCGLNEQPK